MIPWERRTPYCIRPGTRELMERTCKMETARSSPDAHDPCELLRPGNIPLSFPRRGRPRTPGPRPRPPGPGAPRAPARGLGAPATDPGPPVSGRRPRAPGLAGPPPPRGPGPGPGARDPSRGPGGVRSGPGPPDAHFIRGSQFLPGFWACISPRSKSRFWGPKMGLILRPDSGRKTGTESVRGNSCPSLIWALFLARKMGSKLVPHFSWFRIPSCKFRRTHLPAPAP